MTSSKRVPLRTLYSALCFTLTLLSYSVLQAQVPIVERIFSFNSQSNPVGPSAGLIQASDGHYYGVSQDGGPDGEGTVFRIDRATGDRTVLHDFANDGAQGQNPYGRLVECSVTGDLFGTTADGGINSHGTVFRISKDGISFETLHSFDATNGSEPHGGLLEGSDGSLYGATLFGGASNVGVLYRLEKDGSAFSVLHVFDSFSLTNGSSPVAELTECSTTGELYGTTREGGANTTGTVFKIAKDGTGFAVVHSFAAAGGTSPDSELLEASDGHYYGTTVFGGASGFGGLYRLTKAGVFTLLHSFTGGNDGTRSLAGLVECSTTGNLYGAAFSGGLNDRGTLFRIQKDGTGFSVEHPFDNSNGINPQGTPIEDTISGNIVGTVYGGGTNDAGTVYQLTKSGSFSVLNELGAGIDQADGATIQTQVTVGSDGKLYGVASEGGAFDYGVVFCAEKDGSNYTLLHEFNQTDGDFPLGQLIEGTDGFLYGNH